MFSNATRRNIARMNQGDDVFWVWREGYLQNGFGHFGRQPLVPVTPHHCIAQLDFVVRPEFDLAQTAAPHKCTIDNVAKYP